MKTRGYFVRIDAEKVAVEHRASFQPITIVLWVIAYGAYCLFSDVRKLFVDLYHSRDPVIGGFLLLLLLIPFFCGATWLFFASGEVMYCDAHELRFARRRTWGRWHRYRFAAKEVRELRRAFRGGPKRRNFTVLTFQYDGRTFDMLENLNTDDEQRVLHACKALGVDAVITVDDAAAMNKDIQERGWFVNPWKAEEGMDHSSK